MAFDYPNEQQNVTASESRPQLRPLANSIPVYSFILIAFLIGVSLCQFAVDGRNSLFLGGYESALRAGFVKPFFAEGQYWRILTGAVLHAGLIHLAFNCYALYVLGKIIETLSNRAHLPIIFLLSAIGGNVLSYIFLPDGLSVGASGGILGFLGYLAVYGFLRRKILSNSFLKSMIFNIGFIAFYGLLLNKEVDNYAHLGGLLVGVVYGFLQIPKDLYTDPRVSSEAAKISGFAALGVFILLCGSSALLIFGIL
ncbi:MAG TPA: rhomboid family intramembrane serine protease [Pyrinomonadaceae bacterium]|jgi:membrane associated rhomboid family serine protease